MSPPAVGCSGRKDDRTQTVVLAKACSGHSELDVRKEQTYVKDSTG